jgi:DNA ligase-1
LELDVLDKITRTNSKVDKLKILSDNKGNNNLAELLDATFNHHRKFYVNKIELPPASNEPNHGMHNIFMSLLKKLETREITGNYARGALSRFFACCTEQEQEWYLKVLRKDLKAGFSIKTAIKAGFKNIPTFDVMLAKDGKKCTKLNEIIINGVFASPKLDGYRCLAVINEGHVTLYSRNGTEYNNFPTIQQSLKKCFPTGKYVLDGEIMSDDFQSMQKSAFADKRGTTVGDVKYHVFGYVPYNEWVSQKFNMNTMSRLTELDKLSKKFDNNIVKVQSTFVNSLDLVLKMERQYIQQGHEGVMVIPDIPYYLGRKSNKLLKFKTMLSQDCTVTGIYEGNEGTKFEGKMGGIMVTQENGESCECGTGFSDEDREYIWNNLGEFVGKIAEIKYQELTNDGIMRFPVFVRWRGSDEEGKI